MRHSARTTFKDNARSRRWFAGVAIMLGLTVLTPQASTSIFAADSTARVDVVENSTLRTARRATPAPVSAPAPPPPAPAPVSTPELTPAAPLATEPTEARFAREVVELTNAERAAAGIGPVTAIPQLEQAAMIHVSDQRNKACAAGILTHTGTDGSRGVDRILRTGLNISRWGENIACGHSTPAAVVRGWMNSPTHRANILDGRLTHIGIGIGYSDTTGLTYWVQELATLR